MCCLHVGIQARYNLNGHYNDHNVFTINQQEKFSSKCDGSLAPNYRYLSNYFKREEMKLFDWKCIQGHCLHHAIQFKNSTR